MAYLQGGDALTLNEEQKSHLSLPITQTQPPTPSTTGVDVSRAEYDFFALSRQLSRRSGVAAWDNPSASTVNGINDPPQTAGALGDAPKDQEKFDKDIEKGQSEVEEERFDLKEYLTSSNDANQAAGIKHKVRFYASS